MPLYFAGVSATIAAQTHRYSCGGFEYPDAVRRIYENKFIYGTSITDNTEVAKPAIRYVYPLRPLLACGRLLEGTARQKGVL